MLYVTTRNSRDVFTVHHARTKNRGEDGGLFFPFHQPRFTPEQLTELARKPLNHRLAGILNLLFDTKLTGWDVDFAVGRRPIRLTQLHSRCAIADCWHNPRWDFDWMVAGLASMICEDSQENSPLEWANVAARIAVLFAVFPELKCEPGSTVDVAVASGDLSWVAAAVYAGRWGLPVGRLIVSCNEDQCLWELVNRGALAPDVSAPETATPLCDTFHTPGLERLIHAFGGEREVARYLRSRKSGDCYLPGEAALQNFRSSIHVSVVGQKRIATVIPNLYHTTGRLLGPYDALAYCGLQDYQSNAGEPRNALILSQRSPRLDPEFTAAAMTMTQTQLMRLMDEK